MFAEIYFFMPSRDKLVTMGALQGGPGGPWPRDVHGNPNPIPNGNPMGMGITGENGNGNGREWESTSMGMGMTPIPMGIYSHRPFSECKQLQYSLKTCGRRIVACCHGS